MSATSHTTADRRSRKYRGFSLIELMVGLAISLIGTIAMMAAFASFEGQKRTTASSDDAQQNGSFSLFALEQRIRTAGSGLTQGNRYGVWGCAIAANTGGAAELPLAATLPAPFNTWPLAIKTVPVLIASGGTGPDTIGVIGGNPAIRTFKASISGASGTTVPLNNVLGIATGDYLLNSPNDGTGNCSLGVATTVATAPTGSPAAFPVGLDTSNSPAAGFTLGYVFDIGPQPVFNLFAVDPTTQSLAYCDLLARTGQPACTAAATTPIANGIITVKALYGVDDGANAANCGSPGDDQINDWVAPTGAWAISALTATSATACTAMAQIKAIRVAVVAQSELPERAQDYKGSTSLTLFPDLAAQGLSVTVATLPQYRYKVYDTTIPIRGSFITKLF